MKFRKTYSNQQLVPKKPPLPSTLSRKPHDVRPKPGTGRSDRDESPRTQRSLVGSKRSPVDLLGCGLRQVRSEPRADDSTRGLKLPEGQEVQANIDHTHDECPQNQHFAPAQVFHKPPPTGSIA